MIIKSTLIAQKCPIRKNPLFTKDRTETITADDVAEEIWALLSRDFPNAQYMLCPKYENTGILGRLNYKPDKDDEPSKMLSALDGKEGFIFQTELLYTDKRTQKVLIFYKPFDDCFYCMDAGRIKVKPLVRRFKRQHVFRTFVFNNENGKPEYIIYRIFKRFIAFTAYDHYPPHTVHLVVDI